jgi:uncharacterized protein YrrD
MLTPFETLRGCTLAASDGDIGEVREFYFSDDNWRVRYLVVETGSWLSGRRVLIIPDVLGEVDAQSGAIAIKLTREEVRNSPPLESDKPVSRQHEQDLHVHYDWNPYWVVPGAAAGMWPPPYTGSVLPQVIAERQNAPASSSASDPVSENLAAEMQPDSQERQGDPHLRSSAELANRYAFRAQDGETGRVYDFIIDDESWRVRYLVVRTGAWFFGKDVLLAPDWIEGISFERAEIFVNLPSSSIKEAPVYDSQAPISRAYEQQLHDHYGRKRYWDAVAAEREA